MLALRRSLSSVSSRSSSISPCTQASVLAALSSLRSRSLSPSTQASVLAALSSLRSRSLSPSTKASVLAALSSLRSRSISSPPIPNEFHSLSRSQVRSYSKRSSPEFQVLNDLKQRMLDIEARDLNRRLTAIEEGQDAKVGQLVRAFHEDMNKKLGDILIAISTAKKNDQAALKKDTQKTLKDLLKDRSKKVFKSMGNFVSKAVPFVPLIFGTNGNVGSKTE